MPFNNGFFTWNNKRVGSHQIASRVDKFFLSDNAIHLGGDLSASMLPLTGSDHWPITLQWTRPGNTSRRPFHFEAFWLTHPDFNNFINKVWKSFIPLEGSKMFQFQQKLKNLKFHIKQWNQSTFGNIFQAQTTLNKEMKELQQKIIIEGRSEQLSEQETHLQSQILERDKQEEVLWKQKSHEVEKAVHQLKEGKVLGPEGFTSNFFHNFWDLTKLEVWQVVEESRSIRWMLPSMNATFITLTPKEAQSRTPDKFRPIVLCNVIYKIVSKVIALRLKPLLPLLISPEQSGYVEGWQITDSIILTHEIIHSLKQHKKSRMLLKIDLSKAFDRLSWNYMQKMLTAFVFSPPWVRWVMNLISSTFFSILINDIPSFPFHPSIGIRQGDPLSPFLFVIMAEGLGRCIKEALHSQQL
eukprot:PITA_02690